MAVQKIFVGDNVQGFTTAPKFDAVDKIVLNIDNDNYVSSPYAKIKDVTEVSNAEEMTDTSIVYGYIGNEDGYEKNAWYVYQNDQWTPNGEYTPWRSRNNATYVFAYDAEQGMWSHNGDLYSTSQMQSIWCLEVHFASFDTEKAGDKITVVKFGDSDPENEKEAKQSLQLQCDISRSGRVLEGNCPLCKPSERQAIADNLLRSLKGMTYQPYTATGAEVNPLAELGDGITAHGVYGGLYQQDLDFNSLMNSSIGAPAEEELDHEFTFESATERRYNRKLADVGSELEIQADEISARVARIGTGDGFSWSLLETAFIIKKLGKNAVDVLTIDKDGLHVKGDGTFTGTVEAGDFIGGTIKIGRTSAREDENTADVEVDENGTRYKYNFSVNKNGEVIARKLTLMGGEIKLGPKIYIDDKGEVQTAGYNFEVTDTGGLNLGAVLDDENNISWNFTVDRYGRINAKDVILTDGALNIGKITSESGYVRYNFELTKQGDLRLGAVRDESDEVTTYNFRVDRDGTVTASDLKITGGTISIGSRFRVDKDGNMRAEFTNGTIRMGPKGGKTDEYGNTVYAGYNFELTSSGSLYLGCVTDDFGNYVSHNFTVSSAGTVIAKNMKISGGSITIVDESNDGHVFSVNSSGKVTATDLHAENAYLTGTLTVQGSTIEAIALRVGAQQSYNNHSTWTTGSGYGYDFDNASKANTTKYRTNFTAGTVSANSFYTNGAVSCGQFNFGTGGWAGWSSVSVPNSVQGSVEANGSVWIDGYEVLTGVIGSAWIDGYSTVEYIGKSPH